MFSQPYIQYPEQARAYVRSRLFPCIYVLFGLIQQGLATLRVDSFNTWVYAQKELKVESRNESEVEIGAGSRYRS